MPVPEIKPSLRIVGEDELRAILREHIEQPSRLTYAPLPERISRTVYEGLEDRHKEWYEADESSLLMEPPKFAAEHQGIRTGHYMMFVLRPGSHNAWVVA